MSAKLKRTPLFGQDGHLGIPILSNNNKHKLVQKPSPLINMEVGPVSHSQPPKPVMPVSVKKTAKAAQAAVTNNKNVNFNKGGDEDEKKREKYLTAKYGAHQMALIRKRLKVEMWIF